MLIHQLAKNKRPLISFEIFPPKRMGDLGSVYRTIEELSDLSPDFCSVTYGAAGSERGEGTLRIADWIQREMGIDALAHLTCVGATREEMGRVLDTFSERGIHNILALRGDRPETEAPFTSDFHHASDLILMIRERSNFSIGAACYPEGHVEAPSRTADLFHLREKAEAGTDFLISQLFFDNEKFYDFRREMRSLDIQVPLFAGIMPVLNRRQIERMVALSGANLPPKFRKVLLRYEHDPDALLDAGIAYAVEQIVDLLSSGVDGIHLYVMNRPEVARRLVRSTQSIVKMLKAERAGEGSVERYAQEA